MYRVVIALTFMFFSSLILTFRQNDYIIKQEFGKVEYYNRSFFEYLRVCNVKPNRTYKTYTFSMHNLMDLDGDTLTVNIKGYMFLNNLFNHKVLDFDVRVCEAFSKNYLGITENYVKRGNLTKCPIKKGYYVVNNFKLSESDFPPFIPAGRYRFRFSLLYFGYTIITASVYAEVIYKIKY